MIQDKVRNYIKQHTLLNDREQVLVGVSGGADSVALLLILKKIGYNVLAVHCNFHLRGDESMRDETFVSNLCLKQQIKFVKTDFDTLTYAHNHHISIEMAARDLRYTFFEQIRKEYNCSSIAVAHHRDDNAETILLNLMRGTGIKGLCGMQPRNGFVIRPFLCISRKDIIQWLEQQNQPYVTDSSNLIADVERNKIRLQLIPLITELKPSAINNLLRTAENLQEVRNVYESVQSSYINKCFIEDQRRINKKILMQAPSPVSLLHELLTPKGFNRVQIYNIIKAINHVGCKFESAKHLLIINRDYLDITIKDNFYPSVLSKIEIDDVITFTTVGYTPDFKFNFSPTFAYFDADKFTQPLTIRHPKQGDVFIPFGMKGHKLLSNFFTDLKVNIRDRQKEWLLLCGDRIAWIVGRRSSNIFRVDKNTKRIVIAKIKDKR